MNLPPVMVEALLLRILIVIVEQRQDNSEEDNMFVRKYSIR